MSEIITTKEYTKDGVVTTETIPQTVNVKVKSLSELQEEVSGLQNQISKLQTDKENALGFKQVSLDEVAKQEAVIAGIDATVTDINTKIQSLTYDIEALSVIVAEDVNIM